MTSIAKPLVEIDEKTGAFSSVCGGKPYRYQRTFIKQAYVDSDYKLKVALGIPKLLMPYRISDYVIVDKPGLYNGESGLVSAYACFGGPHADAKIKALSDASYKASQVFYSKMADQDSFNLAVSLAEMKKTVNLIGNTAVRLANSYRFLRKGRVKDAFRSLGISDEKKIHGLRGVPKNSPSNWTAKDHRKYLENRVPKRDHMSQFAASSWLELQYGWIPLLLDVYGSAEYVAKLLHDSSVDLIVKATGKGSSTDTYSNSNEQSTAVANVIVKHIVHLRVSDPLLRNSAALGLTNPLNVAWELVPFSFIVDWFLPVGSMLNSLSALQGYEVVDSCTSTKIEQASVFTSVNPMFPCSATATEKRFERVKRGTPPIYTPRLDLPNLLSWQKAATSLSLLKVVFLQ